MKQNTWKLINNAVLETLEGREMMSATPLTSVTLRSGVLSVNGNPTAGTRIQLDTNASKTQISTEVGGRHQTFDASQVTRLNITTGSGADYIYINPAIDIPADIHSGDGNDTIRAGGGNDTIIVGDGNDLIHGKAGNNVVQAGNGNDSIYGEGGNDVFTVGDGNDLLVGGGGTDVMNAGNGNDTFSAGTGHDTITAGTGHDVMIGGLGNTYLYGKTKTSAGTAGSPTRTAPSAPKTGTTVGAAPTLPTTGGTTGTTTGKGTGTTTTTGTGTTTTQGSDTSTGTGKTVGTGSTGKGTGSTSTTNPVLGVTNPTGTVKPIAVINLLDGPRVSGLAVNVDALSTTVGEGSAITSNYAWDFGDPNTEYNQMTGFNAAHVYDKPGNYTVTLTVTNNSGLVSKTTQQLTVAASTRSQIYVDAVNGSDSNSGSASSPMRSLVAAFSKVTDNSEVLLHAGETFETNFSLHVNNKNVLIGRYGTGSDPQIIRLKGNGLSTISSFSATNGLTIQDIQFNSIYGVGANDQAPKNAVGGIYPGGTNITIRNCTFLNVDDAINENANPVGVLVQDNVAPLSTGIRGYFVWGQGSHDTIIGNFAANSTREHIVRAVDTTEINVQDNNFSNLNRQNTDPYDFSKGCVEIHRGSYAWVVGNKITGGDIRVGPLGLWGEAATSSTDNSVIEDNQLTDTFIFVQAGTHHTMIANNVITTSASQAIVINGTDAQGRVSNDINLVNNTGVDTGTTGNFLRIYGWASNITMTNNLWVAPKIAIGTWSTAPVFVNNGDLSCFSKIGNNVWPSPTNIPTWAQGGINYIATAGNGYQTPQEWNSMSQVDTDLFQNVQLNSSYQINVNNVVAGAAIRMAA